MIYLLGGVKRRSKNRILINIVGINNNSPRIFKRSFHSTKSLRYNFILETLNIFQLEDMQSIITQATIALQNNEFTGDSVTKAIDFLLSKAKAVDQTQAEGWGFDISKTQGNRIASQDTLTEFRNLETRMKYNLENTKYAHELAKSVKTNAITKEAAMPLLKSHWKPWK